MNTIHRQNKIITRYIGIGGRFDWGAHHEDEKEENHRGYGRTEAEAIADLKRMDDEWAESMEEERSA